MFIKPHTQTALWLIVSVVLLSSLIPGGPIENRDFSHIPVSILGVFNVFLTTLDLGALVLVYFVLKKKTWALHAAFIAAIGFFFVYAIDLAQIFPRSPTPMSFALALVEVLGMSVAVPLMFSARRSLNLIADDQSISVTKPIFVGIAVAVIVIGCMVVWFATDSASTGMTNTAMIINPHSL